MNFTYGNFSLFSKIDLSQPTLRKALAQYVMDFDVRFTPNNPRVGAVIVDNLELGVAFGDVTADVGVAHPSLDTGMPSTISFRRQPRQFDLGIRFRLFMTPVILETIESLRVGGDAKFHVKVFGTMTGYECVADEPSALDPNAAWSGEQLLNATPSCIYRPLRDSHDLLVTVPQSKWVEMLNAAGFNKSILFEIPVAEKSELGVSSNHIVEAQMAYNQGRYADVIARCRDALDSLIKKFQTPWDAAKDKNIRENMTVEETFRLSWGAVRQITHATHHRNNLKSQFTRPMAQYVLGATCLALSLASKERDLFVEQEENISQ